MKLLNKSALCLGIVASVLATTFPSLAATLTKVDTELSLLIDGSGSIDNVDFQRQLNAYINVFNDPNFFNSFAQQSLSNGGTGQFAVNLIQFASGVSEEIPFTLIDNVAASQAFATQIAAVKQTQGFTNLTSGINLAVETLASNQFQGIASVAIDISTDGFPNDPDGAATAANNALSGGVNVINAIAVGDATNVSFLETEIVGGTNASGRPGFVLQVDSFGEEFEDAVEEKVLGEITPPRQTVPEPFSVLGLTLLAAGGVVVGLRKKSS